MPRRKRSAQPEGYFHVINRSVRRATLFVKPRDYQAFLTLLAEGLDRHPCGLVAFAVMPNHWHLVIGPTGSRRLSALMQWVTATHARRWHLHRGTVGQGPVYQGRFFADPLPNLGDLVRVCRYVERNPLRARLVRRAQDWPWGSLAERLRSPALLPLADAPFLGTPAWVDHVNAVLTPRELAERYSDPKWVETVEKYSDPLDLAQAPGAGIPGAKGGEYGVGHFWPRDEDQAHTHVEGAKRFGLVKSALTLQPGKKRRHVPTRAIE